MYEFEKMYNCNYIVLWDVIAAIYLMEPQLFEDKLYKNSTSLEDLITGKLSVVAVQKEEKLLPKDDLSQKNNRLDFEVIRESNTINLPEIKDSNILCNHMIDVLFS